MDAPQGALTVISLILIITVWCLVLVCAGLYVLSLFGRGPWA